MDAKRTAQTTELLQAMIRNACVNEGTEESGQEIRNTDLARSFGKIFDMLWGQGRDF
jgi:hypothetical protein